MINEDLLMCELTLLQNNRHTSQSWRDRWIKHVSLRPRPDIVDDLLSGPDNSSPAKSATRAPRISEPISGARVPPKAGSHDKRPGQLHRDLSTGKVSSKATSPESPTVPWVAKSKGGRLFTRQEIRLLADNHDDIINIDENEEINAWAAWSDTVRFIKDSDVRLINRGTVPKSYASRMAEFLQ